MNKTEVFNGGRGQGEKERGKERKEGGVGVNSERHGNLWKPVLPVQDTAPPLVTVSYSSQRANQFIKTRLPAALTMAASEQS